MDFETILTKVMPLVLQIPGIWTVLWPVIYVTWGFYIGFLVYAAVWQAKERGEKIHWLTWLMVAPVIVVGYLVDVVWNWTLGSLLFLEPPWTVKGNAFSLTFTRRLNRHYDANNNSWRGKQARFWAQLLNPFDPGHVN